MFKSINLEGGLLRIYTILSVVLIAYGFYQAAISFPRTEQYALSIETSNYWLDEQLRDSRAASNRLAKLNDDLMLHGVPILVSGDDIGNYPDDKYQKTASNPTGVFKDYGSSGITGGNFIG